ncbi:unnamed protein product [Paramecium octaurelia]|uniref:Large ribosomal subunit protein uL15/eL18 domain-containing protein n=1 Tax=Paramecium octaurelia TaxID=43137 RepID=A0A8S1V2U2_PAROT|nr:unnamed protein product [Paramecium octaurelia]
MLIKRLECKECSQKNNIHKSLFEIIDKTIRTDSNFNATVLRRIQLTRTDKYPISISRLVKLINTAKDKTRTLVVVGTVTDDIRLLNVPKINVCALGFTETARKRILVAGQRTQLLISQHNKIQLVLRINMNFQEQEHFIKRSKSQRNFKTLWRAAGLPGSHAKPYVSNTAKKGSK